MLKRETIRDFSRYSDEDLGDEIKRMARVAAAQRDTAIAELAGLLFEVFKRLEKTKHERT